MDILDWVGIGLGVILIAMCLFEVLLLLWMSFLRWWHPQLKEIEAGYDMLVEDFIKNMCFLLFGILVFYASCL